MKRLTDKQLYQRDYYRKNKQRLLYNKKKRYQKDTVYRERALARSRLMIERQRSQRADSESNPTVTHAGREEQAYTIPDMAELGIASRMTLYQWRWKGVIPRPLYKRGPTSYYSHSQMRYINMLIVAAAFHKGPVITYADGQWLLHRVWRLPYSAKTFNLLVKERDHDKKSGACKEAKDGSGWYYRKIRRSQGVESNEDQNERKPKAV